MTAAVGGLLTEDAPHGGNSQSLRPGMIVKLRRRTWRVERIDGGVLTATPIDDFGAPAQQFLAALEQVEPGALPPPSLESVGDPILQRLFLQAIRLDALHGTAPFVAIQRTAVIPVEYQLVPLVMALRRQPARLLIADTTGLGKTIEAGLIISELLARGRAHSVLILTPASLREQWRQQMRDLFYQEFEVFSSETRKRLERTIPPGADPWLYFDKLIVSIDYAKDGRIRPEILKRKWDIVIVDEAHNAGMPHSQNGRKADMDRWEAVRDIASRASAHLLLLSATPHNGYTDSYCSLLEMLSPDLVRRNGDVVTPDRDRAARHVCQRTRKDVQQWFAEAGQPYPFPEREDARASEVGVALHRDYFKILEKLDFVMDFVANHAARSGSAQPVEWLRLHLHRRALSSPEALRQSLVNRLARLAEGAARQIEGPGEAEHGNLSLLASLGDQGGTDAETEDERDRQADHALLSIEKRLQQQYFEDLLQDLQVIKPGKDRKLAALRDSIIPDLLGKANGNTPARVIVFTRFKDTLAYLEKELARGADYDIIALNGDLSQAERDSRFEQFSASPRAVLLATDVISEGLNLQMASCMVVHFDVCYNPSRIDQRNGRVDRFGQRAPVVYVRTLYCKDTTDEDVMHHLVRKLERMRRDLGFSPPFFASEETMLRVLTRRRRKQGTPDATTGSLFGDEESLFDEAALIRMQSEGFYGQADVRIRDVSERLHEVHARFGSPDQVRGFITTGLRRYGCSVEERQNGTLRLQINNPRLRIAGMPDTLETVVLDPALRTLHGDATVLDVGHPLVRRLNAVIREDSLRASDEGARTAAYYVHGQRGMILLGYGVLRATAQTEPPTLLEEVVTFGIGARAAGVEPLTPEGVAEAAAREASSRPVARSNAQELIQSLASEDAWSQAREEAVERAMVALRTHREAMRSGLADTSPQEAAWLRGFAQIEEIGFDLSCLTLLLPEGI